MAGTEAGVPRVAGNWSCNIDSRHDIVKSSWKYRLLCCCVTRDMTQSNGLQDRFVYFFLFSVSCFDEEVIFFIFWGLFREKQNHTITEECPDCCLAKHEGNQMSGLGEDTFPKSKSRPPCSWPVNGGACSIAFVSGQFVVDSGCIAATSQQGLAWGECLQDELQAVPGEKKERRTTRDGRSSGPCASAPSPSDREPVKKGSKSWSTPVCDCLEKETKTVILSDNSNKPELRARSDEATTTRCRKEKLLRLRQRCTCSAVEVDRSPCTSGQPFHGVTCVLLAGGLAATWPGRETYQFQAVLAEISPLYVHTCTPTVDLRVHSSRAWFRTSTRQKRALSLPSIGKEGADSLSKGLFLPMGDHGRLGSLRRAFSPLWRLSTSL